MSLSRSRAALARAAALTLAFITMLVLPAAGQAAVPISKLFAAPITANSDCLADGSGATLANTAGGRPDFCVAFALNSPPPEGDDLKQVVVDTPLGFAGDPTGRPACTAAQFAADTVDDVTCPAASQVGDASTDLTVRPEPGTDLPLEGVLGRAYNLVPGDDEVALIGIVLDPPTQPHVKVLVHVTLRPAPNVGLRSVIDGLPREVCLDYGGDYACDRPIQLSAFSLRFWGSPADHPDMPAPFALLGADCSAAQVTTINATSYDGTPTNATSNYALKDCATAPFGASLAVSTAETAPDVPTAATVKVGFDTGTAARVASPPKSATVTLPPGLTIAAQVGSGAAGLPVCSAPAFAQTSSAPATCPPASAIGTVKITSPLLDRTFTGDAYIGAQPATGSLPNLYIEAALSSADDAPRVKLIGTLSTDDQNRLVTKLDDIPQVPVSDFELSFRGGSNAPLVTPTDCGSWNATMVAAPRSGAAAVTASGLYSIAQDCGLMGAFGGSVAFSSTDPVALGSGTFTTSLSRVDRSQRFRRVSVELPAGQVANLKGVPECSTAAALSGGCDAASRVGSVTALSGVGPEPYKITGSAYLVERPAGAVAGLAIHTPVKIGDIDLGSLDVLARIEIREDLGLRIVADVPSTFKGLPLDLRQLDVALDRAGFALNPTNCGPLSGSATFYGELGGNVQSFGGYQVSGCDKLPFAPSFDASVAGDTKSGKHPTIEFQINNAAGSAALGSTSVALPIGVGVDLEQLPRACPQDTFRAGACPENARIGTLNGNLSITDEPLSGYVILLKPVPPSKLPGIGLQFEGRFAGRVAGTNAVDRTGRLVSRFPAIPDLPLTNLRIQINGGDAGLVIATDKLCAAGVDVNATFGGQSGAALNRTATTICGAPLGAALPTFSARMTGLRKGTPVLRLKSTAATGRLISRVELTLPKGWTLRSTKGVPASRYASLSKLSVKSKASISRRSSRVVRLSMPSAGTSTFYLLTRTHTIRVAKSADRKTKDTVIVRAKVTFKDGKTATVPVGIAPK